MLLEVAENGDDDDPDDPEQPDDPDLDLIETILDDPEAEEHIELPNTDPALPTVKPDDDD